jgi:hypothetical protein
MIIRRSDKKVEDDYNEDYARYRTSDWIIFVLSTIKIFFSKMMNTYFNNIFFYYSLQFYRNFITLDKTWSYLFSVIPHCTDKSNIS